MYNLHRAIKAQSRAAKNQRFRQAQTRRNIEPAVVEAGTEVVVAPIAAPEARWRRGMWVAMTAALVFNGMFGAGMAQALDDMGSDGGGAFTLLVIMMGFAFSVPAGLLVKARSLWRVAAWGGRVSARTWTTLWVTLGVSTASAIVIVVWACWAAVVAHG